MAYWLFKTEPEAWSWDQQKAKKGAEPWSGVRNWQAARNMKEMKKGDLGFFYHTGDERTAVGTGSVVSVDATDPKVPIVRVKVGKHLKDPKTLDQIKAASIFRDSPLVKIGRLSVVPLTEEQWSWFLE